MNTRTSKLIFPAILFLFACLIAFGENGPTPQVIVGSSGISDGSVTNAKLAEPVSVANGGTGATTAAAGLAALGGASLNGSSTVNFAAADFAADSYFVSASNTSVLTIPTAYALASFTEDIDQGSDFTGSVFTAPATGVYVVTCSVQWDSSARAAGDKVILRLLKNGAAFGPALAAAEKIGTETTKQITGSTYIYLAQNETVGLGLIATTATVTTNSGVYNWLQINKLASR